MKSFLRYFISVFVVIAVVFSVFACNKADAGVMKDGAMLDGGYVNRMDAAAGEHGTGEDGEETDFSEASVRPAGLMTAAAWDDNKYYEYFLSLFEKANEPSENDGGSDAAGSDGEVVSEKSADGRLYAFLENDRWGLYANDRVTVRVTTGGAPVAGAKITYFDSDRSEQNDELYAVTDANGIAYLFPDYEEGKIRVTSGEYSAITSFSGENRDVSVTLGGAEQKSELIKLMFVVDVTGSMGDELDYLTNELEDVIGRVAASHANAKIDLAFLFYRDDGDSEKFKYCDFLRVTEGNNLKTQRKKLAGQRASGGGDTPEALDEALELAVGKDWGDENSTKLIFHVFDAPAHSKTANKERFARSVRLAAKKGIRINPVLCSGADLLCEYLGRQEAIHTQGHFCYVTDDSGIGGSHYDPDIPNAVVEKLNDMIVRLIDGYYSGVFADPVFWNAQA